MLDEKALEAGKVGCGLKLDCSIVSQKHEKKIDYSWQKLNSCFSAVTEQLSF